MYGSSGSDRPDDDRMMNDREVPAAERPGVPRWVKIFGLIALALALVLAALMFLGVEHGPGMHSLASVEFSASPHVLPPGTTP